MQVSDLDFDFPSELIAVEPSRPSRVAMVRWPQPPQETDIDGLLDQFQPHDLLVVNESKVIPARVFSQSGVEILFLKEIEASRWQVLFPAREFKSGDQLSLPGGIEITLVEKGLPQIVSTSKPITNDYFHRHGEFALPPYIQAARGERHNRPLDLTRYQSAWAAQEGSVAAPTASLHFSLEHLRRLEERQVGIAKVVLHVGAGTFLPIRGDDLDSHQMHSESVFVPGETITKIKAAQQANGKVWALGTTVTRALESAASGLLDETPAGFHGDTSLFIKPGYEFRTVERLLTNFHQPRTTLIALVAAFAGIENVRATYSWAIEKRFKLFSYGDLSAWIR